MFTEVIALYAITDDLLKAVGHHEDCRSTGCGFCVKVDVKY